MNHNKLGVAYKNSKKKLMQTKKILKTNLLKTILGIVVCPIIRKLIKWNVIDKEIGIDILTVYSNW
jgi:hypothetical protein